MSKWIQAERDDLKIDEKEQTLDIFVDIENDEGAVYSMVRLSDLRALLTEYDEKIADEECTHDSVTTQISYSGIHSRTYTKATCSQCGFILSAGYDKPKP